MNHEFARQLRTTMTDAEGHLWRQLRYGQLDQCKFRRQAPIGPSIADFVCFERKLVLELDGGQHGEQVEKDEARTAWLRSEGFRVLRFWNHDVLQDTDAVMQAIWDALTTPHPDPAPRGGRG